MMMMGFGVFVFLVIGIIAWQMIDKNQKIDPLRKEKRKAMPQTAHEILDERYANDEITREEYLTIVEDIESDQQYQ